MLVRFFLALAFTALACDPDEDGLDAGADEADDFGIEADETADERAVDELSPVDELSQGGGAVAWQCHCWTTCSSNGKGWTKSYFVGSYGTKTTCNKKAKAYCKSKAADYSYANAGCGKRP